MMKSLRKISLFVAAVLGLLVLIPALFSYVLVRHHIDRMELLFVTPSFTTSFHYLRSITSELGPTTSLLELEIDCSRGDTLENGKILCSSKNPPNLKSTYLKQVYGIYLHLKHESTFYQIHSYDQYPNKVSSLFNNIYQSESKTPSAASIALSLQAPLLRNNIDKEGDASGKRPALHQFYHDKDRWCFDSYNLDEKISTRSLCTAAISSAIGNSSSIYLKGEVPLFIVDSNVSLGNVILSFPAANRLDTKLSSQNTTSLWGFWKSTSTSEFVGNSGIRKNPQRNKDDRSSRNNNQTVYNLFLLHPTTYLLLFLNIAFAILFVFKQVPVESVSISYTAIIERHEYWRCWSGSLAHFDPWHLLFNMSSLYSLGTNLENVVQFMSMPFLLMNIALMFWTTVVEMALLYGRIRWMQRNNPEAISQVKNGQAVGFSGVLFAWMVLDCLERSQTCPIPFYPTACFSTQSLAGGWVKFNVGPFISLIVCQFLIPRASFTGHLSGILCGFLLHWRVLPTTLAWSPEVLIPFFFLLDWYYVRKLFSFKHGFICESVDRASWGAVYDSDDSDERLQLKQLALEYGKIIMAVLLCLCFISFNVLGTIFLSQSIITVMFYFISDMYKKISTRQQITSMRSTTGVIYRGFIVSLSITIILNAFSLGSVIGAWVHVQFEYQFWSEPKTTFLILLSLILFNFFTLLLICGLVHENGNEARSDAFSAIYGRLIKTSHDLIEWIEDRAVRNQHAIRGI